MENASAAPQYVSIEELVPSAEYTEEIVTEENVVTTELEHNDVKQTYQVQEQIITDEEQSYVEIKEEQIISEEEITTSEHPHHEQQQQQQQQQTVIINEQQEQHYGEGPNVIVEEAQQVVYEAPDIVQEEVILSSNGQHVDGCDFYVTDSSNDDDVIQLKEEEIIDTPSTETEMSVAMDLANLSQGYFPGQTQQHQPQSIYVDQQDYHHEEYVSSSVGESPSENNSGMSNNAILPPMSFSANNPTPIVMHPSCGDSKPRLSYAQMIAEALMQVRDSDTTRKRCGRPNELCRICVFFFRLMIECLHFRKYMPTSTKSIPITEWRRRVGRTPSVTT